MSNSSQPITTKDLRLTRDGYPAAVIGNAVYVGVGLDGIDIQYAYVNGKSVEEMTLSDFYGHMGTKVADLPGFVAELEDIAEHNRQVERLGRYTAESKLRTPRGMSREATVYGEGVVHHSTDGRGWFRVYRRANEAIPAPYRNENGWYEAVVDAAKVVAGHPHLFTDRDRRKADETLRNWYPDEYEAVNGVVIPEGESFMKDRRLFQERHADDWIAISASPSREHGGMIECTATLGGERAGFYDGEEHDPEKRTFLVPREEYSMGRFGFVIDPTRHADLSGGVRPGM